MLYIIYKDKADFDKQRAHMDKLAKQDGWREETVDDLTIGSGCTRILDAIKAGTFEKDYGDKVLRRHWLYAVEAADKKRRAIKVDALIQKYNGNVDPTTGDKIDTSKAVAKLPADWDEKEAVMAIE